MKKRVLCCLLMLCMVITMAPAMAWAGEGDPETPETGSDTSAVTLNIADGSITITDKGYTQGDAETETAWDTSNSSHELTITGTSNANRIIVNGGNPVITLKDLTMSGVNVPIDLQANAKICLKGNNKLNPNGKYPGIFIKNGGTLTVTEASTGTLTITTSSNTAGIGTSDNKSGYTAGGTVEINGGTITLDRVGKANNAGSSLGAGYNGSMQKVAINGGMVTLKENITGKGFYAIRATEIEVTGGAVYGTNYAGGYGEDNSCTVKVTGGNINSFSGVIEGRTRTELYFVNEETGEIAANTEVTVEENGHKWTALTDDKGRITTYLGNTTTSIQAAIGAASLKNVVIPDGESKILIGAECTCEQTPGTLSISADKNELLISGDSQKVNLSAVYTNENCHAPDKFHGEYENISFEVLRVEKNGNYVNKDTYTSITGNYLSVYYNEDGDDYTVYVRAFSGVKGHEAYSDAKAITVHNFVPSDTLDIGKGTITITDTGYKQGNAETETLWDANKDPKLTITGKSTANQIIVNGGNPVITLKNLTMSNVNVPIDLKADAQICLQGNNTLTPNQHYPGIFIAQSKTLIVAEESTGTLTITTNSNTAGIGTSNNKGGYTAGGTVKINGGTITLKRSGTSNHGSSLGAGVNGSMEKVAINGGVVTLQENITNNFYAIRAKEIEVTGGTVYGKTYGGGLGSDRECKVNVTGGNINSFSGIIEGRTRTELYFVNKDGTPLANTEVRVSESGTNTWKAHTNEKGVVTTYFAKDTTNIEVSYGKVTGKKVTLDSDVPKYLIGGECTCDSIKGITWNHGLPASVNMYDAEDSIYTVAAVVETTVPCNMPIHPNLPDISYELSVNKGGNEVSENASEYASLNNRDLTLKPANAPYTVTLTAKAGIGDAEKTATHTIKVNKKTADEETTVINLSKGKVVINYDGDAYSYTQGESADVVNASGNILLTGNVKAETVTVTVNGGSPQFTFNQNTADNVWKVFAEKSAGAISLDLSGVNGKVRFGLDRLEDGRLSYITSEAVKLNPENGSIIFNADGSVTQGKFTITGIYGAKVSVIGASKEEVTTVTNNTGEALTLKINGRDVTLASEGSYTVKRAVSSYDVSADGKIWAYVLESDQPLYKYNINTSGEAGEQYAPENRDEYIAIYGLSAYASDLEQETVQGYELITAGEGTVKGMGKNDNCESEEQDFRDGIMRVYLDPEITKLSGGFFYAMNALDEVDMYYLKSMSGDLWGAGIRKLNIGPYLDGSGVAVNFMRYLRSITVDEANPSFMTDDGVLYSKDGKTLMQCPTWKKGNYKILDACETIGANAFYGTHLNVLTINSKLSSIGTRAFEGENNLYFKVAYGNQYFSAVDGALLTADGKQLIKLPYGAVIANGGEFVIPEGVTSFARMGINNNYLLKKLTLPSTLSSHGGEFLKGCGGLEELIVNTSWVGVDQPDSEVLRKVTVIEDYPFSTTNMFTKTSMSWVKGNITVSAEDCLYDGKAHSVKVTSNGNTVEYSADGTAWSAEAPEYTQPGTYTVYWRVTKAAGDDYAFAREVYSQKTFTISEIEASEDWFALNPLGTTGSTESPVTLSQPAGSPSLLEDDYTVLYRKTDVNGESTADLPTEVGEYIVTVKIKADGYIEDTLTLGVYTVRENEVAEGEVVLSFVTNGGSYISPIIGGKGNAISVAIQTEKTGYTFAGWYSDSALRTKVEELPNAMPDADATYYAKWTRDEYSITYNYDAGSDRVTADNPSTYNVETPTFTLKAPVRAEYTFLGWKVGSDDKVVLDVTIQKGIDTGDKTYTAVWDKTSYTITENEDGSVTITEGQKTTTITPLAGGKVVVGDDGVITAPAGTKIVKTEDGNKTTVTLPSGGTVDANNETVSSEKGSVITENPDGTVTIVNGENTTTVTPPADKTIIVSEGEVILPAGSKVEQSENGQTTTTTVPDSVVSITVPSGIIDEVAGDKGNISLPGGTVVTGKGDNAGSATIPDIVGSVTVPENNLGGITADDNGAVNLPEGTVITNGKGNNQTVITIPAGGQVNGKGTASSETGSVITENTNGTVTVTDKSGNTTTIKPTADEKVTVSTDGKITVPSGSKVNGVEIPEGTDSVTIPADKVGQVEEKDGALSLPSGSTVTTDGKDTVLGNGGTITEDGTVIKKPSSVGGGGALPPAQKPVIDNNDNVKTELSSDGTKLTIKAEEGYRVVDVIVNGVSKGAVDTLTGLKTGDKVVVVTEKIEDPDAEQAKIERIIKGVEATTLKARSSKTAKGIKITWTKSYGYKVDYYVIYRSTKKNSGYGTKPFYTTKSSTKCYYINTKDLKRGTKYYYKVRGVRVIDGQKYYTEWSGKAIRTW